MCASCVWMAWSWHSDIYGVFFRPNLLDGTHSWQHQTHQEYTQRNFSNFIFLYFFDPKHEKQNLISSSINSSSLFIFFLYSCPYIFSSTEFTWPINIKWFIFKWWWKNKNGPECLIVVKWLAETKIYFGMFVCSGSICTIHPDPI